MDRNILHCDMNGFYASVELLDRPELKNVPMAVCGSPDNRHGVILAKNDIAKKAGVLTAETLWQARRKCPELQIVRPHMSKYISYSHKINEIYLRYTNQVEPFSIDESWLDITSSISLFGDAKTIADEIRKTVKDELGLTLSAGVSFNKTFAKMGSEYKKPDATTVISRDNYKSLLWPLPAGDMFFCGAKTAQKLASYGIYTIGDIARSDETFMVSILGKHGKQLHDYTNGLDNEPVSFYDRKRNTKSVGNGITFRRNLTDEGDITAALIHLSDSVAARLRHEGLIASGVKLDIKDADLKTISRQSQISWDTDSAIDIYHTAYDIFKQNWQKGKPVRLLTVTAINLSDKANSAVQLDLFNTQAEHIKSSELEHTIDQIRNRYGNDIIGFGKPDRKDLGLSVKEVSKK